MAPGLWRGPRAPLPLSAPAGPTPLAAGLQAPGQPWPFVARWRRPAALFAKRLAAWEAKGGPTIGAGPGQLDPRAVEHMSNLSEPLAMRAVKDLISLNGAGVDVGAVAGAGAAAKDAFGSDELGHRTLDLRSSSFSTAQTLKSYAGRFSQFAEFCHDSENISPLEATTATFVRFVEQAELMVFAPVPKYQYNFRALVASVVNFMFFARGLTGVSCRVRDVHVDDYNTTMQVYREKGRAGRRGPDDMRVVFLLVSEHPRVARLMHHFIDHSVGRRESPTSSGPGHIIATAACPGAAATIEGREAPGGRAPSNSSWRELPSPQRPSGRGSPSYEPYSGPKSGGGRGRRSPSPPPRDRRRSPPGFRRRGSRSPSPRGGAGRRRSSPRQGSPSPRGGRPSRWERPALPRRHLHDKATQTEAAAGGGIGGGGKRAPRSTTGDLSRLQPPVRQRLATWEAKGGPTIGAGPGQLDPRAVEHLSNLSEPLAMRAVEDLISSNERSGGTIRSLSAFLVGICKKVRQQPGGDGAPSPAPARAAPPPTPSAAAAAAAAASRAAGAADVPARPRRGPPGPEPPRHQEQPPHGWGPPPPGMPPQGEPGRMGTGPVQARGRAQTGPRRRRAMPSTGP
eukprot:jgi/Tetstr1/466235/TSEL_010791.t1